MTRPKYYIGRSLLIYFLTIITGTTLDSIILSIQQSAPSFFIGVLSFFMYGGLITGVACLPIILILIFSFHYIYKNSKDEKQKKNNIYLLAFICSIFPPIFLFGGELITSQKISSETYMWLLLMIPYALSATFYIIYISRKEDLKNPPKFFQSVTELDDVLDSGFEDDF